MVLRCKTLNFHIFEKNENWKKFEKKFLKKILKIKNLKIPRL